MSTASTWKPKIARIWSESQTDAALRLPFALFICGLLAYAAAFAWHMLTTFDLVNIIRDVNADDSFYYFQIAYNLSQGKFSTFDGGITQTNGYHPVWLLLITPFYWIFDKETALFGIKAFEIMLVAGGVALIVLAAWLMRLAWPLLFAALPMLYLDPRELLQGLEAAIAMFILALLILTVCLYMRAPQRRKWHIAALAFALPWVRIEYIAISLAATAAICAIEWSRQERRSLRLSELSNLRYAYIPLIGAVAGILVYFAYNRLVFGGILPVSAVTKQAWSQLRWAQEGGYGLVQNFGDTLRVGAFDYELLIAFEICAYLLIAWRLALRSNERRDWLLLAFLVGVFGLAAGHIAKFAQTVLATHPDFRHQIWYFVPAYLMTALIIPIRLYVAIHLIRRFLAPRRRIAANVLGIIAFIIGTAFLIGIAGFAEPFKWVDGKSRNVSRDWEIAAYMGAQVMNRALPEDSVIGSWDAGAVGYFFRFPVVNLDGVVNSYDHFHARHIQQTEGINFYRRYGITHFANIQPLDEGVNGNVMFEDAPFDNPYGERIFRLWTYDTPPDTSSEINYSHWFWDNMKPHFNHLSDGVGVVLDGRMAQAFAKDCAPGEPLIWTWSAQKHERTVKLATNPYRTRANMCVDARVLPHSASQTAQAKMTTMDAHSDNLTERVKPIIRSDFDVYLADGSLIYAKSQCNESDTAARFFVSVFPVDVNDLSDDSKQSAYHAIEFDFDDYGAIAADGRCWTTVALPNYPIAEIHTGQYVAVEDSYHYPWEATYKVGAGSVASYRVGDKADFETLAGIEPVIRSDFDVYLIDGSLIYAKQQCSQEDAAARFFVSVFPAYADSLPAHLRQSGYGSLEFKIVPTAEGRCWAEVLLPNYLIAKIHTGQYAEAQDGYAHIWEGDVYRIGVDANFESPEGIEPVIRSHFDVYLIDGSLIYAKQQCSQEDMTARFFVSVFPVDANDLSDDNKRRGYHSIEFDFGDYGAIAADGMCWTEVDLPNYPIAALHTGQYVAVDDGYHYPWEGHYRVNGVNHLVGAEADFGFLTDREPIIRSDFDVYLIADRLIYANERCSQEDVAARFFINIFPAYEDSLPGRIRQRGYASAEFNIADDTIADGKCWAEVSLPDYPIAELRTGQYVAVEGGYHYPWDGAYRID